MGLVKSTRRRFIGVRNLVRFLRLVSLHPRGAGNDFLVCDNETVSTREFISLVMQASGTRNWILPIPPALMVAGAKFAGLSGPIERLVGNLDIDDQKARTVLGWKAPYSMLEELQYAVDGLR